MIHIKHKEPTFLFYDYETFGTHTSLDKPAQFACIRTDMNLKIVNDPQCFYCFPPDDYLPDPQAILITHITPEYTKKYGTNEYEFSKKIYNILTVSNTCIVGYNNINFDDEITRNIFYRNFFDPYEWSWKNGNSRWDMLNLLRTCYALRPNGIKWPINQTGLPSFKLSDLTKINNLIHFHAHDAMSDVYATIEIAKLVKKKQTKLFNFFFQNRNKKELYKLINLKKLKPILYISHIFGVIRNNISCILPIIYHQNNSNILISIDLFKDIKKLIFFCKTEPFDHNFFKKLFNLGIVLLHLNRCPMLAPIKSIRKNDQIRLNFDSSLYETKINFLKRNNSFIKKIQTIFSKENYFNTSSNVDLQIYNSFFNLHDKKIMKIIRSTKPIFFKKIDCCFHDSRLKILFFRCRARNFFHTLNDNEKKIWLSHCFSVLNPQSIKDYRDKIKNLLKEYTFDSKENKLLNSLLKYVYKTYKKLCSKKTNLN